MVLDEPTSSETSDLAFSFLTEDSPEPELPAITPDGREDSGGQDASSQPEVECSLTDERKEEITQILLDFQDVFSETPGCTSAVTHDIEVCSTERVKPKLYPIPVHLKPYFEEEVDLLLHQ